jgi:hypothetical protein
MSVTPLAPAGVAQVPSPRQKVEPDALVPLFRLPTGRLPRSAYATVTLAESACPLTVRVVGTLVESATVQVELRAHDVPLTVVAAAASRLAV